MGVTRPGREFASHRAKGNYRANGNICFFEMISCSYQDVVDSYHRPTSGRSAAADRSGRVRTLLTTVFHARPLQTKASISVPQNSGNPLFLGSPEEEMMTSHCPTGFEYEEFFLRRLICFHGSASPLHSTKRVAYSTLRKSDTPIPILLLLFFHGLY